ncbi:MAG: CdaR family protein [Clostridia bacterium]|nr:CdaR family protein [Clostridia bacterium]
MNRLLKNSITLKIISIMLAVLLWFIVNPFEEKVLTVPLKVINENTLNDKGIVLKNKNYLRSIAITISGSKEKIKNISASDFEVMLDFSRIQSASEKSLTVDTPVYLGTEKLSLKDLEIKPKAIAVDLGKIEENPFYVQVETTGKLKENYEIISKSAIPHTISLQGLDSLINSVAAVKVYVDVSKLDRNITVKKECRVYNKKGEEIPELSRKLYADVKLEVAKRVPVIPIIKGIPAKNYIGGDSNVKPGDVLITGLPEDLAGINSLETMPIDIENANKTISTASLVKLPEGIRLVNASREVAVNVAIEQLVQKSFVIKKEDIKLMNTEIDNSLKYEIQTLELKVEIKGSKKDLETLETENFMTSVDVAGKGPGTYQLPLKIGLPDSVKLIGEYSIDIKVDTR